MTLNFAVSRTSLRVHNASAGSGSRTRKVGRAQSRSREPWRYDAASACAPLPLLKSVWSGKQLGKLPLFISSIRVPFQPEYRAPKSLLYHLAVFDLGSDDHNIDAVLLAEKENLAYVERFPDLVTVEGEIVGKLRRRVCIQND